MGAVASRAGAFGIRDASAARELGARAGGRASQAQGSRCVGIYDAGAQERGDANDTQGLHAIFYGADQRLWLCSATVAERLCGYRDVQMAVLATQQLELLERGLELGLNAPPPATMRVSSFA